MRALITLVLFLVAGISCLPLDAHTQETETTDEDDSRLAADNIYPEFVTNEADPEFAADDVSWRLATDVVVDEKHLIPDGEADNAADMEYYKQLIRNSDGEKERENDEDENDDDDDDDDDDVNDDAEENGDEDLFEGDIVPSESLVEKLHPKKKPTVLQIAPKNAILGDEFRWPFRALPYKFVPDYSSEERRTVIKMITKLTKELNAAGPCVVLRPKMAKDTRFAIVTNKDACSSRVGHQKGLSKSGQRINLGYKCINKNKLGRIQHEFIHALGFWHEQSRTDRNDYITVVEGNIIPRRLKNFKPHYDSNNQGFPYDYGSVMHYPKHAFAIDRSKLTIITKDRTKQNKIGQRKGPSKQDIAEIRRYYKCF